MFQLKLLRRQPARSASGPLVSTTSEAVLVRQIMTALAGALEHRKAVSGAVEKTVSEWVSSELKHKGSMTSIEAQADFIRFASDVLRSIVEGLDIERDVGVLQVEVGLVTRLRGEQLVQDLTKQLLKRHRSETRTLGSKSAEVVMKNLLRVSKLTEAQARERPYRVKFPSDIGGTDIDLVEAFLGGTAIGKLLLSTVPVTVTDRARLSHAVCVAGSGHGKTQFLGSIIAAELARPKGQETGLVILDSQSDLVNKVKQLKRFAGNDRLLLVDAADVSHPVALNLFDGGQSLASLPPSEREQALLSRIELTEYVLTGLFGSDMTARQATLFRYLIQLMLSIPGATLETLRQCLEEPKAFVEHIDRLDGLAKDYLSNQFMSRGFNPVRGQVLQRLYAVLQSGVFSRMFTAKTCKLDIGQALDAGRVVLVNTSKQALGDQSKVFGRFVISLVMRAAMERAKLKEGERRTSFLLIDEAADYFSDDDKNLEVLLSQGRKYGLGCMLFLQSLEQMPLKLRSVVLANCANQWAGGVSAKDARALAAGMQCTPEFILAQMKRSDATDFAAYARNITPRGVSWRVPFFALERQPVMTAGEFDSLLERTRRELCA